MGFIERMKKIGIMVAGILLCTLLFGCSQKSTDEVTTITIDKSGRILNTIVEDFEKEYYAEDELKSMIESDLSAYHKKYQNTQENLIKLESVNTSEQVATVKLIYSDAESYAQFNDVSFFSGTVSEAYQKGYSFEGVTLNSVKNDGTTLDKHAILSEGSLHVVITDEALKVRTYNDILYTSSNFTSINKKEATIEADTGSDNSLAYLLFK